MARRKKGELPSGNIRRQVYLGKVPVLDKNGVPQYDQDGKPLMKRKYKSVTESNKTHADLEAIKVKTNKSKYKAIENITLREAIQKYVEQSYNLLSPNTIKGYDSIQVYSFAGIIDMKLSKLTTEMLEEAVNAEVRRISPKTKKQVSPKTVINSYGLVAAVLKKFVPNLDTDVKMPQKTTKKNEISSPSDIFAIVKGTDIELPVLLAMWLSFTMSEIKGLSKSKSLSSDGEFISIAEVYYMWKGEERFKPQAKNEIRNRTHRLPKYLLALIEQVETDRIVTASASSITHKFERLLKANNMPHMTFHDRRHVSASLMHKLHIPDKYAQERGGWKTDNIMKNTYTQTFSKERIEVDETINDYFINNVMQNQTDDLNYKIWNICNPGQTDVEYKKYIKLYPDTINQFLSNMQHEMQHALSQTH